MKQLVLVLGIVLRTVSAQDEEIGLYERIYEQTKCQHIIWNGDRVPFAVVDDNTEFRKLVYIIIYFLLTGSETGSELFLSEKF